jgi:hypothetical protein
MADKKRPDDPRRTRESSVAATEPRPAGAASPDESKRTEVAKKKTQACQVFEDEVFWANVVASLRKSTIAKVLSPLIRDELRKMVKEKGIDPDDAWTEAQATIDK